MRTISQRELRNNSGEIMRQLERGESFRVTNRGVTVGQLTPAVDSPLDTLTLRAGSQVMQFPEGVDRVERTEDIFRELRGER